MQVLVVQPHEGQFDPRKLALGHAGARGTQAQFAHLLPMRIRRAAHAHARDRQDLGANVVLCGRHAGAQRHCGQRAQRGRALQQTAAADPRLQHLVMLKSHVSSSLATSLLRRMRLAGSVALNDVRAAASDGARAA